MPLELEHLSIHSVFEDIHRSAQYPKHRVRDTEVEIRQRGEPPNSPRIGH
jgi:hypothetical protein